MDMTSGTMSSVSYFLRGRVSIMFLNDLMPCNFASGSLNASNRLARGRTDSILVYNGRFHGLSSHPRKLGSDVAFESSAGSTP
jgi:muramidase (phage lysozyme)